MVNLYIGSIDEINLEKYNIFICENISLKQVKKLKISEILQLGFNQGANKDDPLPWHHDNSFQLNPPQYIGMYCIDTESDAGRTLFCDMESAYQQCDNPSKFNFEYSYSIKHFKYNFIFEKNNLESTHKVLQDGYFFYGPGLIENENMELSSICFNEKNIYKHVWKRGDLIIWNNLKVAHSRESTNKYTKRKHLRFNYENY